ncbi:hypothetical protein AN958_01914 [Leucoagaricus sp. SymC.cos]|nr:hypothetical protein AN958_01914 [Leucoagaricus sp. SymC.cos]
MNLKKVFHFEKRILFDFWKRVRFPKSDSEGLVRTDRFIFKRKDRLTPTSQHRDQDQPPAPLPPPAIPTVHVRATNDDASSVTTADQNEAPTIAIVETATVQPNNEGDNTSSGDTVEPTRLATSAQASITSLNIHLRRSGKPAALEPASVSTPNLVVPAAPNNEGDNASSGDTVEPTRLAASAQASATSLNIHPRRSGKPAVLEPPSASTPNLVVPAAVSQHVQPPNTSPNTVNSIRTPDENTVYLNSPALATQKSAQSTALNPSSSSPSNTPSQSVTNTVAQVSYEESWVSIVAPQASYTGGSFFNQAQNFKLDHPTFYEVSSNAPETFMRDFAKHTIRGAAVDSSARDPPPRCHPGTRLSTIEETRALCISSPPPKRLAWIVGPAGVGKSAIMQTVAETSPNMGAALFFSVNGRNDSTKAITTLVYQLATKFPYYREYIHVRLTHDPTIFDKAIPVQFNEFITEPFVNRCTYRGTQSLIIFIDGVDECDSIPAHNFYKKTELSVDSNQSCADVEKYLRDSFVEIQSKYPSLQFRRQWPTEHQLIKIITAARGLFAFGSTTVRFVDDPQCGNPQSQLQLLLETIDNLPTMQHDELDTDPMALLYALYDRIMSCIPKRTFLSTVKLLYFVGILPGCYGRGYRLSWAAEWLRMTPEIAYGCLHHLHSVLRIPPTPEDAVNEWVEVHHKSFKDYLAKKFSDAEEFEKVALDTAVVILMEITSRDSDTIHALRVMTRHGIDWDFLPLKPSPDTWLTEDVTVVHVLKELQIFQCAQVGNLDLDRIWESREDFHILYLSKYPSQVSPRTQARIACDDDGNRKHKWSTSVKKGNHYFTMRKIRRGICRCCEGIKNDLMNVQANTPDTVVAIWTGGDGWGLVIYDFVDPDNPEIEWRYILPYEPDAVSDEEVSDEES